MSHDDMIDTAAIAEMVCASRAYVTSRLVKRPDFPAPVLRLSQKTVRWSRASVLEWLQAQQIRGDRKAA